VGTSVPIFIMTPENFCYWLQGYIELENPGKISAEKTQVIKDHLNLVFKKETPVRNRIFDGCLKKVNHEVYSEVPNLQQQFIGDGIVKDYFPMAFYNGHPASC